MVTRRSALVFFVGALLAVTWKNGAMAEDWTLERFEGHITTVFREIEADAMAATTTDEIGPLRRRLNKEWLDAKPGAFLPADALQRLRARLREVEDALTNRFVVLKETQGPREYRIVIERGGPTLDNFFYAPHYSNKDQPSDAASRISALEATETRLGLSFPQPLRDLYARQNGGHTDFSLASNDAHPPYEFASDDETSYVVIQQAYDVWLSALPDGEVLPLEKLRTLGDFSDDTDFGDEDDSWRNRIPDIDHLIPIGNHGWDIWLCLDYRDGRSDPKVVLFDDSRGENDFRYETSDFATFFAGLRRHAITVEHGVKIRGSRRLEDDE